MRRAAEEPVAGLAAGNSASGHGGVGGGGGVGGDGGQGVCGAAKRVRLRVM